VYLLEHITGLVGRGEDRVDSFRQRMERLQNAFRAVGEEPLDLLKVTAIAHLYFLFQVFSLFLVMKSLGVTTDLTPLYFILPMASLANFSPTPGGSGTYEAAMAAILTGFLGIGGSIAVSIAILYRFTTFWPGLLIGYISMSSLSAVEKKGLESIRE